MPSTGTLTGTQAAHPSGLVSIDGRSYPLKAARIQARAEGGVAATTFTQSYGNPYQEPLEVMYILPLPANGAVTGYTVRLGERVIRGEVRRREEAREEYRKALLEGRTAALLEQQRADTFIQKLGSLPPGQDAEVEIEVLQPLAFLPADGETNARWEYRFPTVAGVRYQGAPGRVSDAADLDADRAGEGGTPVRLEAVLLLADGPAGRIQPQAPGQELRFEESVDGVQVALKEPMKLNRDLVIRWSAAQQEAGIRVVEGKGLATDDGRYALITLTPPAEVRQGLARDLTILIDASGSMSGIPITRAKIVAEELLCSLDPGDRFEILVFASDVRRLVPKPTEASKPNIQKALKVLGSIDAGGATEMTRAMIEALKPLRPESQRQVILITDGYIGFENEVIGEVMSRLAPGARLHAVGIGSAPNRTLTRGAARAGRGVEILVGDDDDARAASRRLLQATVRPVLTDVEVKGSAVVGLAPARPQDVLMGQPLVLTAELSQKGGELTIQARLAGKKGTWTHNVIIYGENIDIQPTEGRKPSTSKTTLPLGALFGKEAIEDLELQFSVARRSGEAEGIELKIERLGLRHRIASRKTSLIAISEDRTVDPRDPRRREKLAVELPAEVSAEGVGLKMFPCTAAPPSARRLRRGAVAMDSLKLSPDSTRDSFFLEDAEEADEFVVELERMTEPGQLKCLTPTEADQVDIYDARILLVDGSLLVFEFETPVPGFMLPHDGEAVTVWFSDGTVGNAWVVGSESSPAGPHDAGLTLRVGLNLEEWHTWYLGETHIQWQSVGSKQVDVYIII
jgi:Ca-activated chloride channel family protein